MSRLAVFESQAVSVVFGLLPLGDGRADPFFEIEQEGEAYVVEGPGADGLITRCGTNANLFKITLSFKGSSQEHAKLSAIHIADKIAENGAGVAPLLVKDNNGSTLIMTDRAWITKMPKQGYGVTPADVQWELHAIIEPAGFILGGQ